MSDIRRDHIVKAESLSVGYGGSMVASGLHFSVGPGDALAVVGPNGSGKTTLLKTILGIIPPLGGSISLFGKKRLSADEAERLVSYIPQRLEVDRTFPISLGEMLSLGPRAEGGGGGADRYVDMLELRGLLRKKVGELSGGQMQRALLAYAISKGPSLLVMDEPTSWVDVKGADCVLCIIEEFRRKGIAMIIVSHGISELRGVCTHVLGIGPGPEESFFEKADSPGLELKTGRVLGASHHEGHAGRRCRF